MVQIAVVIVAIGLVILGVKGFTRSGIPISKSLTLTGTTGKVVGFLCILAGLAFIPAFVLAFWLYGQMLR